MSALLAVPEWVAVGNEVPVYQRLFRAAVTKIGERDIVLRSGDRVNVGSLSHACSLEAYDSKIASIHDCEAPEESEWRREIAGGVLQATARKACRDFADGTVPGPKAALLALGALTDHGVAIHALFAGDV